MPWRRGIAFAAVHLAVALPMVAAIEANEAAQLRSMHAQETHAAEPHAKPSVPAGEATGNSVAFDLCATTDLYTPNETILIFANPAAFFVTAWRLPCAPRWSVSGIVGATGWSKPSFAQFATERNVDAIFLLLILFQWFLIGSFPPRPHRRLWADPAARITACTLAAGALSFVPHIESLCTLPMFYALAAWVWWLSLAVPRLFLAIMNCAGDSRLTHKNLAG